jgi:cell division transport system permease protein
LYSLFSSLGRIAARPWATLLTLLVMALALALPLLLFVLLENAQQLRGDMQEAGAISVFPQAESGWRRGRRAGQAPARASRRAPRSWPRHRSRGCRNSAANRVFADAMKVLRENPLPAVLIVTPSADAAGADAPALLAGSLGSEPEVDLVQYDAPGGNASMRFSPRPRASAKCWPVCSRWPRCWSSAIPYV